MSLGRVPTPASASVIRKGSSVTARNAGSAVVRELDFSYARSQNGGWIPARYALYLIF